MAGGAGTRLWPLSRKGRPKQLLRLFGGLSLLQHARRRLAAPTGPERRPLFEPDKIWVITSADYIELVGQELPDIPARNLIGEPMGRDTANAIGLAAHLVHQRDPQATMCVFTADHLIQPESAFANAVDIGLEAAESNPDHLVTFGVTPTSPHTGYGYVCLGEKLRPHVFRVENFTEKPTRAVAEEFLKSGKYLWNSGMFAWRTDCILHELADHLPDHHARLGRIAARWDASQGDPALREEFAALPRISIDFGVMEKAARVLTVEMRADWLDVGSWTSIGATATADGAGCAAVGARLLTLDARNIIAVSETGHLIAAIGVEDLVVVHSPDATLVCRRDQEQRIRELVDLRSAFGDQYE